MIEIILVSLMVFIIIEVYVLTKPKKNFATEKISMLVDTSVLIDGRVVDLAQTGFLLGEVVVPKSVLAELQLLADGSDHAKRERARLGLDAVKKLQDMLGSSFSLLQDGPRTSHGVDEQLITLAKQTDSAILTIDYNLNKVAQVEGVRVLNINELAKSLRMVHLPGDVIAIELTQKGQSTDQGVGYLSDGTMVVVEQGKKFIGSTKSVEIIRSLQTDAGKMMFARIAKDSYVDHGSKNVKSHQPVDQKQKSKRIFKTNSQSEKRTPLVPKLNQTKNHAPDSDHRKVFRPKTSAQREDDLIKLVDEQ